MRFQPRGRHSPQFRIPPSHAAHMAESIIDALIGSVDSSMMSRQQSHQNGIADRSIRGNFVGAVTPTFSWILLQSRDGQPYR